MESLSTRPRKMVLIGIGVLLLHVGYFYGLAVWLWSREHYQFFPLVLCASGWLAWHRLRDANTKHIPCITFRVLGLGTIWLTLFGLANFLHSNWLGSLAGIVSIWCFVWYAGGSEVADKLRGPVSLLLLVIPLPINLDLQLVIWLQKIASATASSLLDMQGIRHTISGVGIHTVDKSFVVEEACSGVHSLFSCVCAVIFLSVTRRSGVLRLVINVAQTVGWVIAANAIRVFFIIYAFSRWKLSLDAGWPHDAIGVATYALALLMSFSTDRLFLFLIPHSNINLGRAFADSLGPGRSIANLFTSVDHAVIEINRVLNRERLTKRFSKWAAATAFGFLFVAVAAVGYSRIFPSTNSTGPAPVKEPVIFGNMSEIVRDDALPQQVEQWQLVDVKRVNRSADDPLGTNSTVFTYGGDGLFAVFSVDGFYSNWHDLAYCYTALGWSLNSQRNFKDSTTGNDTTVLQLNKNDGDHAITYFSCFDSQLKSVKPGEATIGIIPTLSVLTDRLPWSESRKAARSEVVGPTFQLQLICASSDELLDSERENLMHLFGILSQHALQSLKKASP